MVLWSLQPSGSARHGRSRRPPRGASGPAETCEPVAAQGNQCEVINWDHDEQPLDNASCTAPRNAVPNRLLGG